MIYNNYYHIKRGKRAIFKRKFAFQNKNIHSTWHLKYQNEGLTRGCIVWSLDIKYQE